MPKPRPGSVFKFSGQTYMAIAHASNVAAFYLSPQNSAGYFGATGTRLSQVADAFEWYRFTDVKVIIPPQQQATGGPGLIGYQPGEMDTALTTFQQVAEMASTTPIFHIGATSTTGSAGNTHWRIPKGVLRAGQVNWFRTQIGTPDVQFEVQGRFWSYNPTAAGTTVFMVQYTVEFKDPINIGVNPRRLQLSSYTTEEKKEPLPEGSAENQYVMISGSNPGEARILSVPAGAKVLTRRDDTGRGRG